MKIVTAAEMREIDRVTTERHRVPSLTLMENAGQAVSQFVCDRYPKASRIVVICGKGNNGGDGFVAARHLHHAGKVVEVLLLSESRILHGDAAEMFSRLPFKPVIASQETTLRREFDRSIGHADLFIDAILGTGFKPPVAALYAAAIDAMNATKKPIVAIDVPSGADADSQQPQTTATIVHADTCVTFTAPKPVHIFGDLVRHETVISLIGSPDEAIQSALNLNVITSRDYAKFLAPRALDSNKGLYGHALILAGSFGKSGASAMAGMAALRAGAGLVSVATPRSVLTSVASFAPELMTEPLPETESGSISGGALEHWDDITQKMNVLAIGPGITQHPETVEFVREALRRTTLPTVIDADGLNALVGHTDLLNQAKAPTILTPHPGEMARLTGLYTKEVQADRIAIARDFAKARNTILVLKGYKTVIAAPSGEAWLNCTGNPGMATGGTGDVLTGILTGLLAQHPKEPLLAACAAVHLHGLAGDAARDHVGELSLTATDLIHHLPDAIRHAKRSLHKSWTSLT